MFIRITFAATIAVALTVAPAATQDGQDPEPLARCCSAAQVLPGPEPLGCTGVCVDPNYSNDCYDLTVVESQFVIIGQCLSATSGVCMEGSSTSQVDLFRCRKTDQCTLLTYSCQWVKQTGATQAVTYPDCDGDPCN